MGWGREQGKKDKEERMNRRRRIIRRDCRGRRESERVRIGNITCKSKTQ